MKRIGLFIDGSNIFMSAKTLGFRVDYTKLLNYYKSMGEVAHAFYFTALPPKEVNSDLRKMVDYVRHNGYVVVEKETREYLDDKGLPKLKGNMDVEIAVYAGEVAASMSHMVLFSGDGDFRCLIESMQRKHNIHCTVVSARSLASGSLRSQANEFVDLSTLRIALNHEYVEKTVPIDRTLIRRKFSFK